MHQSTWSDAGLPWCRYVPPLPSTPTSHPQRQLPSPSYALIPTSMRDDLIVLRSTTAVGLLGWENVRRYTNPGIVEQVLDVAYDEYPLAACPTILTMDTPAKLAWALPAAIHPRKTIFGVVPICGLAIFTDSVRACFRQCFRCLQRCNMTLKSRIKLTI